MDRSAFTCAVMTVSDKGSRGERADTSGPQLQHQLAAAHFRIVDYTIVPDQPELIRETIVKWVDEEKIDLIITTGGTGVSPSDRTPEATRGVIDYEIPGIGEAMRMASFAITPSAILSRGLGGVRKESLIINLPGSERAARENLAVVLPALPHALEKIKGGTKDCVAAS
ncbi:MAG: MogA/MoaB family molybdenum cofactor biosynthesis protein [Deltaproteobacteria bacterium]|nr:MogA/MoaB family molybdenum cofactor biosynthesis protein [Deltaproteobacteria bacterium]